ncbi:hypothetical protein FBZ96_101727 [Bradyrhizobium stylosanthis]|uniref:Uncharacterized protein n=1 Tax=Bradyrhizobium stylosanthis TaxID=1803665 RepID=A0A560EC24_9BRAD|nr:hypothetical protein FBZ96_101727 [Bradyrhizobium stylosanthis]
MGGKRAAYSIVVPAKAGTHNHRETWLRGLGVAICAPN